ncbi:MAG TPA: nitrate reductase molybdenum cofactor assembly chaperone [Oleiagrimonas sp.]|nr:nitrate reductase molybdenum cofactor assembly chaperone [Oleiagrimonas sp.]
MAHKPTLLLRALSALLAYPDAELRAALPEISEVIGSSRAVKRPHRDALLQLIDDIAKRDELDAQGRYVDLFDRGRRTSLNLFEHVHGDGRKRGPAMLELRQRYLDAGLEQVGDELPDHLPLLLEYLSCRGRREIRDTLGEIAHIVRKLGNTLVKRHSPYAAVMGALLAIGGEKGLDADAAVPPPDDFDRTWEEKPAFAPPEPNPAISPERRRA